MSKTLISVVIIVAVVVGGYFIVRQKNGTPEKIGEESSESGSEATSGKKIPFSEFAKQGGSYKCEVQQYLSDFENSGTVYFTEGKLRGDFSTVAEGKKMDSSIIMKDGYMYNWSSAAPQMGIKVKVSAEEQGGTPSSGDYSWNTDQVGDYDCDPWTVDNSKFELPSAVNFTEIKS